MRQESRQQAMLNLSSFQGMTQGEFPYCFAQLDITIHNCYQSEVFGTYLDILVLHNYKLMERKSNTVFYDTKHFILKKKPSKVKNNSLDSNNLF